MSQDDLMYPKHYSVGGVYAKELTLARKGDRVVGHKHKFDHLSLLAKGKVLVVVEGVGVTYTAPTAVNVKAGFQHEIIALVEDCLWYCVHAVPEGLRGEELLDDVVISR